MKFSIYDLQSFYNQSDGKLMQSLMNAAIDKFWSGLHDELILGFGYCAPYLDRFSKENNTICVMLAGHGVHHWCPENTSVAKNKSTLVEESELPFENTLADRALLIHNLEHSEFLDAHLSEVWRTLKPGGRALIVVPNRSGFWSRTDWSPLGQGRPFSKAQICNVLRDNGFVYERSRQALFVLPIRRRFMRKVADIFERFGFYCGLPGGVHIIEVTKQVYAKVDRGTPSRVMVRGRDILGAPAYQSIQNRKADKA